MKRNIYLRKLATAAVKSTVALLITICIGVAHSQKIDTGSCGLQVGCPTDTAAELTDELLDCVEGLSQSKDVSGKCCLGNAGTEAVFISERSKGKRVFLVSFARPRDNLNTAKVRRLNVTNVGENCGLSSKKFGVDCLISYVLKGRLTQDSEIASRDVCELSEDSKSLDCKGCPDCLSEGSEFCKMNPDGMEDNSNGDCISVSTPPENWGFTKIGSNKYRSDEGYVVSVVYEAGLRRVLCLDAVCLTPNHVIIVNGSAFGWAEYLADKNFRVRTSYTYNMNWLTGSTMPEILPGVKLTSEVGSMWVRRRRAVIASFIHPLVGHIASSFLSKLISSQPSRLFVGRGEGAEELGRPFRNVRAERSLAWYDKRTELVLLDRAITAILILMINSAAVSTMYMITTRDKKGSLTSRSVAKEIFNEYGLSPFKVITLLRGSRPIQRPKCYSEDKKLSRARRALLWGKLWVAALLLAMVQIGVTALAQPRRIRLYLGTAKFGASVNLIEDSELTESPEGGVAQFIRIDGNGRESYDRGIILTVQSLSGEGLKASEEIRISGINKAGILVEGYNQTLTLARNVLHRLQTSQGEGLWGIPRSFNISEFAHQAGQLYKLQCVCKDSENCLLKGLNSTDILPWVNEIYQFYIGITQPSFELGTGNRELVKMNTGETLKPRGQILGFANDELPWLGMIPLIIIFGLLKLVEKGLLERIYTDKYSAKLMLTVPLRDITREPCNGRIESLSEDPMFVRVVRTGDRSVHGELSLSQETVSVTDKDVLAGKRIAPAS